MFSLPDDLLCLLAEFLYKGEQRQFLDCCKAFEQLKKFVRCISLDEKCSMRFIDDDAYRSKILDVIVNPRTQLKLSLFPEVPFNLPGAQAKEIGAVPLKLLSHIISRRYCISHFSVYSNREEHLDEEDSCSFNHELNASLDLITEMCQYSMIEKLDFCASHPLKVPYFPKIKYMCLKGENLNIELSANYARHLQKLTLKCCSKIDVSCLGQIPELEVLYCSNVIGIAGLIHNKRVLFLNFDGTDLAKGLTYCRHIQFFHPKSTELKIDFTQWKQVKSLDLGSDDNKTTPVLINRQLPVSLRRALFFGSIINNIDLTTAANHLLSLTLKCCNDLLFLDGYHLDNILVVKLDQMNGLQSLNGLGGKNQKVVIRCCKSLKEYSAIRSVPKVQIDCCPLFNDLSQVKEVQSLSILSVGKLQNYYYLTDRVQRLRLRLKLDSFDGLENVPHLTLRTTRFDRVLLRFLSSGKMIHNQVVVLVNDTCFKSAREISETTEQFRAIYEVYLSSTYILSINSGSFIFIRKGAPEERK